MMGTIHIAGWGLLLGAIGQSLLFASLSHNPPSKIIYVLLLIPWLTVYTISFCRRPPCGPRRFRHVLTVAMCWYVVATLLAETLCFIFHPVPHWDHMLVVARVLMYLSALSFVVFLRACIALRRLEAPEVK